MEGQSSAADADRVLAARAGGHKLEVIKDRDGWFMITQNGAPKPGCRWPAECLEQCVQVYMALLRQE